MQSHTKNFLLVGPGHPQDSARHLSQPRRQQASSEMGYLIAEAKIVNIQSEYDKVTLKNHLAIEEELHVALIAQNICFFF